MKRQHAPALAIGIGAVAGSVSLLVSISLFILALPSNERGQTVGNISNDALSE
jgi:hypothetical protein